MSQLPPLQNYTVKTQHLLQPIVLVTVVPVTVHTTSQMQQVIYIGATPLPLIHTFKPSVANCPTRILTVKILTSFAVVAIQWIKKWPPLDMHTTPTHTHTHTHTHTAKLQNWQSRFTSVAVVTTVHIGVAARELWLTTGGMSNHI